MKRYRITRTAPGDGAAPGKLQERVVELLFPPNSGEEVPAETPLTDWQDVEETPAPSEEN